MCAWVLTAREDVAESDMMSALCRSVLFVVLRWRLFLALAQQKGIGMRVLALLHENRKSSTTGAAT